MKHIPPSWFFAACLFFVAGGNAALSADRKALPARTSHLLLDSRVVESTANARLSVGSIVKHPANPLFREDKPWEVRFDNLYANVRHDAEAGLFKCWYSPFIRDVKDNLTSKAS